MPFDMVQPWMGHSIWNGRCLWHLWLSCQFVTMSLSWIFHFLFVWLVEMVVLVGLPILGGWSFSSAAAPAEGSSSAKVRPVLRQLFKYMIWSRKIISGKQYVAGKLYCENIMLQENYRRKTSWRQLLSKSQTCVAATFYPFPPFSSTFRVTSSIKLIQKYDTDQKGTWLVGWEWERK